MRKLTELKFDNTYRKLPEDFYHVIHPTPFKNPHLVAFNPDVARFIGLDSIEGEGSEFVQYMSGNKLIPGSEPLAMYYTGHQFGVYNRDIGDGRAILLGEIRSPDGEKWDFHLKGAGRTNYSRVFDGRAVFRSTIREYLCSQTVHSLGIPTTHALCIIGSDEKVERETTERGAMMLRVAESHVRFGSFEAFYYTDQKHYVKMLADYVINNHFPHIMDEADKYARFLEDVVDRTARLIALWQACGFTHGVMNTDNMSILGLTIDYGPYGFLEEYNPEYTPNHSDHFGRYSFANQPAIALWNLNKLTKTFEELIEKELMDELQEKFKNLYGYYYLDIMKKKLGLMKPDSDDAQLIKKLIQVLKDDRPDYSFFFRNLGLVSVKQGSSASIPSPGGESAGFAEWLALYRERLRAEGSIDSERRVKMDSINPKFILRNYLAENAIRKAVDEGDYSEIERLLRILKSPFSEQPGFDDYAEPSPEHSRNLVISCSS